MRRVVAMPRSSSRSSSCCGRLGVEGEHQDARRVDAARHELEHAADERLRLAGTGRRQDAGGAVSVLDRGALRGVQPHAALFLGEAGRRSQACGSRALAQEHPDVFEVEPRALGHAQGGRREDACVKRKTDAVRQAARHERVHELEQDGVRSGEQLFLAALPEPDSRCGARPPLLSGTGEAREAGEEPLAACAGVRHPGAPPRVPCAGIELRAAGRELAGAGHVEQHDARPGVAGRREAVRGGVAATGGRVREACRDGTNLPARLRG